MESYKDDDGAMMVVLSALWRNRWWWWYSTLFREVGSGCDTIWRNQLPQKKTPTQSL